LKSFISQDIDELRRPYDRLESEYQRRSVFFASVNPKAYLVDDTGNVRWWTIAITAVNHEHKIDVQQLWAEAAHYFEQGERWWLTKDEEALLQKANAAHESPNSIEELIHARFDWNKPATNNMSATEVLVAIGYDKPSNAQAKDAGAALRKLTGGEPFKSSGRLVFRLPPSLKPNGASRYGHNDEDRPF
jgi:putative DNA primase/helicase